MLFVTRNLNKQFDYKQIRDNEKKHIDKVLQPQENVSNIPYGKIIFFQHGLNTSRNHFLKMVGKICHRDPLFIDGGVVTFRDDPQNNNQLISKGLTSNGLGCSINLLFKNQFKKFEQPSIILSDSFVEKSKELHPDEDIRQNLSKIQDIKEQYDYIQTKVKELRKKGYTILFRTEFSNPEGSNLSQVEELKEMISTVVNKSDEENINSIILVGHSKGGVVNLLLDYGDKDSTIDETLSIATPYLKNAIANYIKNILFWNDALKDLANGQDFGEKVGTSKNIAIVCDNGLDGDGCVSKESQSFAGNDMIYPIEIKLKFLTPHNEETFIDEVINLVDKLLRFPKDNVNALTMKKVEKGLGMG